MNSWDSFVESLQSQYRNDAKTLALCNWMVRVIEQRQITDIILDKCAEYQIDHAPVTALCKACHDFGIEAYE